MRLVPSFLFALSFLLACGGDDDVSATDGGGGGIDGGGVDAGGFDEDGGLPADAAPLTCAFNRECAAAERCECDETSGCFCLPGARGTGVLGDACTTGNDCASAVCVEGPTGGTSFCSDECGDDGDCMEPLARCLDVAFVGQICVRVPPA
jgi:hypothetical protein